MGKMPVRMKAVVYALSPFQQKVMSGLWKDLPGKIHHKVSENWLSTVLLLSPLVGTYSLWGFSSFTFHGIQDEYVQYYKEREKMEHRY